MRFDPRFKLLTAALLLAAAGTAAAHTAWLEPEAAPGAYLVRFGGHAGKLESYAPEKLKSVQALDAQGRLLPVTTATRDDGVHAQVQGAAALLTLHFDNGIWSRAPGGKSVARPMNESPGATEGTAAVKYGKTIAVWTAVAAQPAGQPFELVPLSAAPPRAGQPLRLRVLIDGQPAAGVEIARGEAGVDAVKTDAQGVAAVLPQPGWNRFWSGRRTPVAGNPRYTQLSIEYLLVFEAR